MRMALGRVQVQLQVTLAPTRAPLTIGAARERAERRLADHSTTIERAYRRERARRAVEDDRVRWENRRLFP